MARNPVEIADAVVDRIKADWPTVTPPAVCERAYEIDVSVDGGGVDPLEGRRVWVVPLNPVQTEYSTRGRRQVDTRLMVVVAERYVGDERPIPQAWVDTQVAWVFTNVFEKVGDVEEDWLFSGAVRPESNEWDELYDPDMLAQHAVFWAGLMFVFREQ